MNYSLTTLPSGLRVVTVPMPDRNSAAVAIWVQVGSRHETSREAGISHLLEHLVFKGTKKRSARQIKEEIEGVGGMLNAYTSDDVTCFFAKLLHQHVPLALEVLADMVNHATIDDAVLEKEKAVVLEEMKMYRDLPAHHVHELMADLLWPRQPLGRPIAGLPETVSKLTRTDIKKHVQHYYQPQNILVAASGQVQHREIVEEVQKWFPAKKRAGAKKASFKNAKAAQEKPQLQFVEKVTEQTHFVIGVHGISRYHEDRYSLGLLNIILGANMSSRLFEEVREKRGLAYEIRTGLSFYHDTGAFVISAGVENTKTAKAIDVILRQLEKISKEAVKQNELRRAKDYFMSQLYMGVEDTLDHLLWVGERALDQSQLPDREKIFNHIESVTATDIKKVARNLFQTKKLNLTLIGPISEKDQNQIRKNFKLRKK